MSNREWVRRVLCITLSIALFFVPTIHAYATLPPLTETLLTETIETETLEVETLEVEDLDIEQRITECITTEIYLEELVLAEDRITEQLLDDESIDEVLVCKTIYVPQTKLQDFSEYSQTEELFGYNVGLKSLLTKVAVGTGVIVTLVVLKKVGLEGPIASIVVGAADESLKFALSGAIIGSLLGGFTGAADSIDETRRTSAVIGFATATVGLILSAISFAFALPSGGSSTISLAAGIKLVIAGCAMLGATAGTVHSGYNMVKTYAETDSVDIDWNNVSWDEVGTESAIRALNYGSEGYMWGAIVGAVYGGVDGYEKYHKYNTPYTDIKDRLEQASHNKGGHWEGDVGQSDYVLDEPIKFPNGTEVKKITYNNGVPDFSRYAEAEVNIPQMTEHRWTENGVKGNFQQADEELAKIWTKSRHQGRSWTASDVRTYRTDNSLSWHEMSNMESMQLVPREIHGKFQHFGGVAECKAMIGQEGGAVFD